MLVLIVLVMFAKKFPVYASYIPIQFAVVPKNPPPPGELYRNALRPVLLEVIVVDYLTPCKCLLACLARGFVPYYFLLCVRLPLLQPNRLELGLPSYTL